MSHIKALEFLKSNCTRCNPAHQVTSIYCNEDFLKINKLNYLMFQLQETNYCCTDNRDECYYFCLTCRNNIKKIIGMVEYMDPNCDWETMMANCDKGFVNLTIIKHLRSECKNFDQMRMYNSVYGYSDEECFQEDLISLDWEKFVEHGYCVHSGISTRCFCEPCKENYKKVKYHINNLVNLAIDWNLPYDHNIDVNTIREIQTFDQFKESNPKVYLKPEWKIKNFGFEYEINTLDRLASRKQKSLDCYIDELKDYDVIHFRGDFAQSLLPLTKLTNLKGVSFGFRLFEDINILESLPNLQFICVRGGYYRHLNDKVYFMTYWCGRDTDGFDNISVI